MSIERNEIYLKNGIKDYRKVSFPSGYPSSGYLKTLREEIEYKIKECRVK